MWRATKLILLTAALLALAWRVYTLPGQVTARAGAYNVTTSVPAAVLLLFIAAIFLTILLRVAGGLWKAPVHLRAWRSTKRNETGDTALQRSLVAIAAEDGQAAATEAKRAQKFLGDLPLVLFVRAEAERLAGHDTEAADLFQRLTETKELKFVGHQGLAKLHHAKPATPHLQSAGSSYPGAPWVRAQQRKRAIDEADYETALALSTQPFERAAFATAAAQAAVSPDTGLQFCRQALKSVPGFIPAITTMAALLRALGREKAARKLLLSSWREKPHALLAQAWSPVKTNKLSVAQDALALAAAAPDDIESEIYLAQTALAAGLTAEAARHANRALGKDPQNPRAKAVLTTSSGNIAPPSSAGWVCEACTATSPNWAAICQVCGKIGAITWHDMH